MSNQGIVLVLAKVPEPGYAKTRLSPPATHQQAADIAAAALLDTLAAASQVDGAQLVVSLAGDPNGSSAPRLEELQQALQRAVVLPQRGTSFADRLATAHTDVAERFPGLPVFQIGMDTPQLTQADLADGLQRLRSQGLRSQGLRSQGLRSQGLRSQGRRSPDLDGVLGPAVDGGWWALGLREPRAAAALRRVTTSRPDTGARTMTQLQADGLRMAWLETHRDVDTMDDAWQVAADHPHGRFAAAVRVCPPAEPSPEPQRPEPEQQPQQPSRPGQDGTSRWGLR